MTGSGHAADHGAGVEGRRAPRRLNRRLDSSHDGADISRLCFQREADDGSATACHELPGVSSPNLNGVRRTWRAITSSGAVVFASWRRVIDALGPLAAQIAVAELIGEDDHDVRRAVGGRPGRGGGSEQSEQGEGGEG